MNASTVHLRMFALSALLALAVCARAEWVSPEVARIKQEIGALEGELHKCEQSLDQRKLVDSGKDPELARLEQQEKSAHNANVATYQDLQQAEKDLTEATVHVYRRWDLYSGAEGTAPPPPIMMDLFGSQILSSSNPYEKSLMAALRWEQEQKARVEAARATVSQSDEAYRAAYAALSAYQSRRAREQQAMSTAGLEKQCDVLRQKLADAGAVLARFTPAAASRGTQGQSGSQLLSGPEAVAWLKDNGYLNPDGTPAANLQDWQDQTHSSLSRSNHPLRGVAGDLDPGRDGRLSDDITISVERRPQQAQGSPTPSTAANAWNLDDSATWSGAAGDAAPDSVSLLEQQALAENQSRTSHLPGYAPTHEEWLTMNEADQRYYFEPMRARARAEHEAEMAEERRQMVAEEEAHRRTYEFNAQSIREGQIKLDQTRAAADEEAARAARYNEGAMASSRWMMDETQRLLRQRAVQETAQQRASQATQSPRGGTASVSNNTGQPVQADAPVYEPARNALLQAIRERHQRWHAAWCPRIVSGCSIVPDGARDELLQWTRNATKQDKIERIRLLLDCYDSCVMANPKSERQAGQCRNDCKNRIP